MLAAAPETTTHALVRKPSPTSSELEDRIAEAEFRLGFYRMVQHFGDAAAPRSARLLAEVLNRNQVNSLIMALVGLQGIARE